jgi:hypothetical protein
MNKREMMTQYVLNRAKAVSTFNDSVTTNNFATEAEKNWKYIIDNTEMEERPKATSRPSGEV